MTHRTRSTEKKDLTKCALVAMLTVLIGILAVDLFAFLTTLHLTREAFVPMFTNICVLAMLVGALSVKAAMDNKPMRTVALRDSWFCLFEAGYIFLTVYQIVEAHPVMS